MIEESNTIQILGNRYQLLQQVGQGGMASVFEAYDLMLERTVAIKLLRYDFSKDENFRSRFKQEAKSAANLTHPNIVTVHDFGADAQEIYIVMEYVAGKDLKTRIREKGRYPIQEGLYLMIQACNALGYAHRAGIIHCDVKPQNMIVSEDDRLKITDFGIAQALSSVETEERSDVVWGSPQYLSPEQALGDAPSPASDVYSLGVVMYELFTGQLPFRSKTTEELIKLHQTSEPPSPSSINPECPPELEHTIMKVLSKQPTSRYRTADQLGSVLTAIYESITNHPGMAVPLNKPTSIPTELPPPITYEDYSPEKSSPRSTIDWKLIGLELLCILLVGGLIPFWLYIWFSIKAFLG